MQLPQDIQLIIKEYSMPIYKKSLHYKAITLLNSWSLFESSKYHLLPTPYSYGEILFDNHYCYQDIKRGSSNNKCMFYLSFSYMFPYTLSTDDEDDFFDNNIMNNINMDITNEDLDLTDVITLS
jgi:hypothetical protein